MYAAIIAFIYVICQSPLENLSKSSRIYLLRYLCYFAHESLIAILMEPRYDIKEIEARIYAAWEKSGFFNPDVCVERGVTAPGAEPFSIIMPPPNANGSLHAGHALFVTLEDIMTRFARMQGKRTLWVPGA